MDSQKSFVKSKLALCASITTAVLTSSAYSAENTPAVTHLEAVSYTHLTLPTNREV